jgi:hypothetical protein
MEKKLSAEEIFPFKDYADGNVNYEEIISRMKKYASQFTKTDEEIEQMAKKAIPEIKHIVNNVVELRKLWIAGYRAANKENGCVDEEGKLDFLLHLIDVVWKEATQSEEVPDTQWAMEIIAKAISGTPDRQRKNHLGYFEGLKSIVSALSNKENHVASDNKNEAASVATLSSTVGNSVEQWVSVKEKGYPEHNVGVLVFIPEEDFHITSGMWDVSRKWVLLDEYRVPDCEVTHWMPLVDIPEEYKKERDENNQAMDFLKKYLPRKK